jgi:putative endonuclease
LVIVEVKMRSSLAYGLPENGITPKKRTHLLESTQFNQQQHPELEGDWRIDVVAVMKNPGGRQVEIIHFENAIS